MYTRSFPDPMPGSIPPNYCGNAFDLAKERRAAAEEHSEGEKCEKQPSHTPPIPHSEQKNELLSPCPKQECTPHEASHSHPCRERKGAFSLTSLFSRRDGRRIAGDDILLAGLIILLLSNGADEEIILLLGFLFLAGL